MTLRDTRKIRDQATGEMITIDIWQARDAEGKRTFTWSEYDGQIHRQPQSAHFRSIKAMLEATQEDWARDAKEEAEIKFYEEKAKLNLPKPQKMQFFAPFMD